ncbi:MAG: glucarate dehydratase [Candidatus Poribacteria bacterium]|nr:MAG: glucarate dehydratase [Candidatus Poribacteria bacterium]
MRIAAVRVTPIAFADPPLLNSWGVHEPYALRTIVELESEEGCIGLGEGHGARSVAEAIEAAREELIGHDPWQFPRLRALVKNDSAYSILETACLDLIGKTIGRRVCDLLGGAVREEVPYSAYLFYKFSNEVNPEVEFVDLSPGEVRTPEALLEQAKAFVARFGFRALKLKGGVLPPEEEIETLQRLHDHFGEGYGLRIDPNAAWSVPTSIRVCHELERRQLRVEYVEDPTEGRDGMAEVARATRLPLATNMCVTRFEHIADGFRKGSIRVLLIDHHGGWQGLLACRQLARVCEALGWQVSMHSNSHLGISMAAMTHLGAAIPNLDWSCDTHYPWAKDDVIQKRLEFHEGRMRLPAGPGLGVELDRDRLEELAETRRRYGRERRDDAGEMRRFVPDWQPKRPPLVVFQGAFP